VHETAADGSRPCVQILVTAPDGEIRLGVVQRELEIADRVREIEADATACRTRRLCDRREIEGLPGAELNARPQHERDLAAALAQAVPDRVDVNEIRSRFRRELDEMRRGIEAVPGELRDDGVPVCPRHGEPVSEVGPRPKAYPVSIVVDDLPRRRIVVREGKPVEVGRAEEDPRVVSVAPWLHEAAASWISPVHVRLEVRDGDLVVTDLSENGTVVWQRTAPDDRGATRNLRRAAHRLGEWDTVELYTGIELARGDRRLVTVLGRDEPGSVLVDAPTAAHHQVRGE